MHTKGPWYLFKDNNRIVVADKVGARVALITNIIIEWQANALLIAAAPQLYREFIVSIERGFALGYSCEDQLELYKEITGEDYDFDSAIAKGD